MTAACTKPITAVEVPCWRSASVMVKITPLNAKLISGATITAARRIGTRHTRCRPSTTSRHSALRSTAFSARNRPRIRLTVPNETT